MSSCASFSWPGQRPSAPAGGTKVRAAARGAGITGRVCPPARRYRGVCGQPGDATSASARQVRRVIRRLCCGERSCQHGPDPGPGASGGRSSTATTSPRPVARDSMCDTYQTADASNARGRGEQEVLPWSCQSVATGQDASAGIGRADRADQTSRQIDSGIFVVCAAVPLSRCVLGGQAAGRIAMPTTSAGAGPWSAASSRVHHHGAACRVRRVVEVCHVDHRAEAGPGGHG